MDRSAATAHGSPTQVIGFALIGLLGGVGVLLAYRSGSYLPHLWLPILVAVAALALAVLLAGPHVAWTRDQMALLGAFAALSLWTLVSTVWAGSFDNAWEESNRTFLYLVGFFLSASAVAWSGRWGARVLVWTVLAGVLAVAAGAVTRLAAADDLAAYFSAGRLHYPLTYWNGLAALYMIGFWLALGLSAERATHASQARMRPLLVGLAVILAELALLPQSRGAFYAFFLVSPFYIALSTHRFRALLNLALVAGAVAVAWSRLVAVMPAVNAGGGAQETRTALATVALTAAAAAIACSLSWFLEMRMGPLGRPAVRRIAVVLAVLAAVTTLGVATLYGGAGDIADVARTTWAEITSDTAPPPSASSRFSDLGLNGRLQQWRVAGEAFAENPALGLGAQNFESFFDQHRRTTLTVRQPHSQPMQLLAELGLPGMAFWMAALLGTLGRATAIRFRTLVPDRRVDGRALTATVIVAVLSWFIHSSADWLWQLAGATWPAVLLLGGLLAVGAEVDRRPSAMATAGIGETRATIDSAIRWIAVALTILAMASASLQFLFLRYIDVAAGTSAVAPATAVAATRCAARLNPFSPLPAAHRAGVYAAAARRSSAGAADSDSAELERLALAYVAWEEATGEEPGNWLLAYRAGTALLDYRDAASSPSARTARSGAAPDSLGASAAESGEAAWIRTLETERLDAMARTHLEESQRLNPLSRQVREALDRLSP